MDEIIQLPAVRSSLILWPSRLASFSVNVTAFFMFARCSEYYHLVHETELYYCVFFYSESQCQSYCLLKGAAASALQDLTRLGVLASVSWSFDNIKFDHTRFFLKQQEKVISDHFKEGMFLNSLCFICSANVGLFGDTQLKVSVE